MTDVPALPPLQWKPSPNFSDRLSPIDKVVLHDCEGGYQSSINTFLDGTSARRVSAHIVLKEDGSEATQMVAYDKKAWHCKAFNSPSIGIEMAGYEERGFAVIEWGEAAAITAYLCRRFGIPVQWAHGGQGPGICRHFDLGIAGGGHVDPTQDTATWTHFLDLVEAEFHRGVMPAHPWGVGGGHDAPPAPAPNPQPSPQPPPAPSPSPPALILKLGSVGPAVAVLQLDMNRLVGSSLDIDGDFGKKTQEAVKKFQRDKAGIAADGIVGPITHEKIAQWLARA